LVTFGRQDLFEPSSSCFYALKWSLWNSTFDGGLQRNHTSCIQYIKFIFILVIRIYKWVIWSFPLQI